MKTIADRHRLAA